MLLIPGEIPALVLHFCQSPPLSRSLEPYEGKYARLGGRMDQSQKSMLLIPAKALEYSW